jgi:hypothetical protein
MYIRDARRSQQQKQGDHSVRRLALLSTLALLGLGSQANADPTLTLDPTNGTLTGAPGQTVGWGFTLDNSTDYLLVTGTQFCGGGSTPPFCNALSPNLGTYTDFAGPQFLVVGPTPESPSLSQTYDNTLQTGLGSFAINPTAALGSSVTGSIELTYDLYSVDPNAPNFNPNADQISVGNFLVTGATVDVASPVSVPEPGTLPLMAAAMGAFGLVCARNRRVRSSARR